MASQAAVEIIIKARDDATKALKGIGKSATAVGKTLTKGLTLPLVGIGIAAAKVAMDFESQMAILGVAASSAGVSLDDLRGAALKAGADTKLVGISASESADAITGFFKAGMTAGDVFGDLSGYLAGTAEVSGAFRAAVDLAAASELSLAMASDAVAISMATFGLSAEDATMIADNFVATADASVSSVGDLTAAMVNIGPTAAAFGFSLEDTNVALGILSQRGIVGAEAGTALKSMMTNLMRPTDDVTATLKELNVSLFDASGNMLSLPDIMAQLEGSMAGLTQEQQLQNVQTLAGTFGMKAMQTLLTEGVVGWQEMSTAVGEAATAQEIAGARMDTFAGATEALMGTLETLLITVGTPLINDFLRPLVEKLSEVVGQILEADPRFLNLGLVIAGVAAAAGPVLMILGTMVGALGALLSPIGLVVAVVAALALAWATNFGGIRDKTQEVFDFIQNNIGTAMEVVQGTIEAVTAAINSVWSVHGEAIMATAFTVWAAIQSTIETVTAFIQTTIEAFIAIADRIWTDYGEAIMATAQNAWETVLLAIETITAVIQKLIETVLGAISQFWTDHAAEILNIATTVWEAIQTAVDTIINLIQGIMATVMALISGDWDTAWATIKETAETVWEGIKTFIDTTINAIQATVELVVGAIKDFWDTNSDAILAKAEEIWAAIQTAISTKIAEIKATIETWLTEAVATIQGWANNFAEAGKAIIGGLIGGIKARAQDALNAAISVVRDAWNAAKNFLGIGSPSKLFTDVGEAVGEGFSAGMLNTLQDQADAGSLIAAMALDSMRATLEPGMASIGESISAGRAVIKGEMVSMGGAVRIGAQWQDNAWSDNDVVVKKGLLTISESISTGKAVIKGEMLSIGETVRMGAQWQDNAWSDNDTVVKKGLLTISESTRAGKEVIRSEMVSLGETISTDFTAQMTEMARLQELADAGSLIAAMALDSMRAALEPGMAAIGETIKAGAFTAGKSTKLGMAGKSIGIGMTAGESTKLEYSPFGSAPEMSAVGGVDSSSVAVGQANSGGVTIHIGNLYGTSREIAEKTARHIAAQLRREGIA